MNWMMCGNWRLTHCRQYDEWRIWSGDRGRKDKDKEDGDGLDAGDRDAGQGGLGIDGSRRYK